MSSYEYSQESSQGTYEREADGEFHIASNAVLVPLTNSLYVNGELTNTDRVLVDVGTGFLVDKVRLA